MSIHAGTLVAWRFHTSDTRHAAGIRIRVVKNHDFFLKIDFFYLNQIFFTDSDQCLWV